MSEIPRALSPHDEDGFVYQTVSDLETLSLEDLERLWDMVPTEDREYLQRRYRQKLKQQGIGDDAGEIKLIDGYLNRYTYEGLVPAGDGWLRISALRRQQYAEADDDYGTAQVDETTGIPQFLILFILVFTGCFLIFLITRMFAGGGAEEAAIVNTETPTATPTLTLTPTLQPTITPTPTATPIALVESDRFVEGGERSNRDFFPVSFSVQLGAQDVQPRVFVVQERLIDTSEWVFEPNPDVVSWVSGTRVRPVLGIPYSPENEALLANAGEGTRFTLRMNTGGALHFLYARSERRGREGTDFFGQGAPGIVLVLIGETDATSGMPTPQRLVVYGNYAPPEIVDLGAFSDIPARPGEQVRVGEVDVTVSASYFSPLDSSPTHTHAVVDVRLSAGASPVHLAGYRWTLEVDGIPYTPQTRSDGLPERLDNNSAAHTASLVFLVPQFAGDALLRVRPPEGTATAFALTFMPPPPPINSEGLDVQLRRVSRDARNIYVEVRLYNPQPEGVTFAITDAAILYGFTPNPVGPRLEPEEFEALYLAPETAYDVRLRFAWNGDDPFAQLTLAGRVYAIRVIE